MLKTIDECIEHSNKIINDLLEYSPRTETGTIRKQP
jgi:hypothetical protein